MDQHYSDNQARTVGRRAVVKGIGIAGAAMAGTALGVGQSTSASAASPASFRFGGTGDSAPDTVVYPEAAHAATAADPGILDVKRLFGAKGDGVTDDTAALVAAYDEVIRRYRTLGSASPAANQNVIYLPNGTYLVSDSIVYSLPLETIDNGNEILARVRFQGQNRDGVVIKLADNSPGFQTGADKPLLSLAKGDRNGSVSSNSVQNLTLDTGRGNPGAIGLRFCGANNAAVRHVTIRSGDGQGSAGLSLPVLVTQGSYRHLLIEGFDYAISAERDRGFGICVEHVRIRGQRVAGIRVIDGCVSVRDLYSHNRVPAAKITGASGHLVMVDSVLVGASGAAIESDTGHLFARNVRAVGYDSAITRGGKVARDGAYVGEYASHPVSKLFEGRTTSLNLPVEDPPRQPWPTDVSTWTNVKDHGAVGDGKTDDTAAIQAAMNTGKPVVYFAPGHRYLVTGTVAIPASVERVNFMYTHVAPADSMPPETPMFSVLGSASDKPLRVEDLFGWIQGDELKPLIDHASTRTLVISDVHHQHAPIYRNSVPGGKVFLDAVSCRTGKHAPHVGVPGFIFDRQRVWIRFCNSEYGKPAIINRGSTMWMLGGKTEGAWTSFATEAGGRTEVLGAIINVYTGGHELDAATPILSTVDSEVSATLATFSDTTRFHTTVAAETRAGETRTLDYSLVPRRINEIQSFLPLYVGAKSPARFSWRKR
ncbi:glycosyl hydrolase family 28-related protein [Streptosporangium canum]|uniref:glycosyl hydrolase family 28-related protein n=1 Tax=Streptosporangium canum TaxID=324952 RepID=UPI0036AED6E4